MIKKCGIIYMSDNDYKFLLVLGKKSDKWGFPKGHMEYGEREEDTAIREFFEETGIKINLNELENKIRFKNNIYFKVKAKKYHGNFNIQDTNEIMKAQWFTFFEIINLSKDNINFGLRNWIQHQLIHKKFNNLII